LISCTLVRYRILFCRFIRFVFFAWFVLQARKVFGGLLRSARLLSFFGRFLVGRLFYFLGFFLGVFFGRLVARWLVGSRLIAGRIAFSRLRSFGAGFAFGLGSVDGNNFRYGAVLLFDALVVGFANLLVGDLRHLFLFELALVDLHELEGELAVENHPRD